MQDPPPRAPRHEPSPEARGAGLGRERLLLIAGALASVLLAALSVARLGPPEVLPASAPLGAFSAARARVHLERVAREPHPMGSAAAGEVERYIATTLQGLGLEVESMTGPACTEAAGLRRCGNVRNVIGTLPGRTRQPALLLSAHYDSVPNSPGAGDDGAAVAALLETARALGVAAQPERDVVFAFLDGEEDLLLGAAAFCAASDGREIGLVANFDARGNRGAATLVGASPGSAALLGELLGGLSQPVVNSFFPSVASVLPNATDAEIYERCGLPAFSFAFADGFESYHQGTDTPARLDLRSLQHHGSYALDVARRFAWSERWPAPEAGELVFFDVAGGPVVRYSSTLARLFGAALLASAAALGVRRLRRRQLAFGAAGRAAAAGLVALLAAAALGAAVARIVSLGWPAWSDYLHAPGLAVCAAGLLASALLQLLGWATRRGRGELPGAGALGLWLALAGLSAALAPGLSHLFSWPAAALLAAATMPAGGSGRALARGAASLLAVLLLTPVMYSLAVVMGSPGVPGVMVCATLILSIWADPLAALGAARLARWARLPLAAGVVGAVALRLGVAVEAPAPLGNAVAYALDTELAQARWISADVDMDDWKRQLLGDEPTLERWPAFASYRPLFMRGAPSIELEAPRLELVADGWGADGQRTLRLRARSPRGARGLQLWETRGVQFSRYRFDGAAPIGLVRFSPELDLRLFRLLSGMDDRGLWSLNLFAPGADGVLLELSTSHAGPLELRCSDSSEGWALQPAGVAPRGARWTQGYPGDHTLVSGPPLRIAALPPP